MPCVSDSCILSRDRMYLECWKSDAVLAVVIVSVWLTLMRALARPVRDTVMVSKRQEGRGSPPVSQSGVRQSGLRDGAARR